MARAANHRTHRARLVATLALLAGFGAGVFAWFGPLPWTGDHRPSSTTVTLPVEDAVQDRGTGLGSIPGSLPTRLVAASAGIDAPISEVGVTVDGGKPAWETAWRSVGHHMDSARPGQPGNVVLTGHVSVADPNNLAAFKTLDRLQPGDVVEIYAGGQAYSYRITSVTVVPPDDLRILRSDHTARLTLITCTKDLKNRLVVVGILA